MTVLLKAVQHAERAPLVERLEQRLITGQVRQLSLSGGYALAAHVWLQVALADLRTACRGS